MNKLSLVCLIALAVSGCAGLAGLAPPEVTLVDLRFTDLTLFETSGTMVVRITNENPESIVLEGGSFKLYLDGLRVGTALSSGRLEIPRLGSAVEEAELTINNLTLATRLAAMLERPVVDYRIKTRLYLEGGFGTRRLNSVYEGRLDLERAGEAGALDVTDGAGALDTTDGAR